MNLEESIKEKKRLLNLHRTKVNRMIQEKQSEQIISYLEKNMEVVKSDNDLMAVWYLGRIVRQEMEAGVKNVFEKEDSLEALLERYQQLKFFLRRIEHNILEDKEEFYSFLSEHNISEFELMGIINNSTYYKEKVWAFLINKNG